MSDRRVPGVGMADVRRLRRAERALVSIAPAELDSIWHVFPSLSFADSYGSAANNLITISAVQNSMMAAAVEPAIHMQIISTAAQASIEPVVHFASQPKTFISYDWTSRFVATAPLVVPPPEPKELELWQNPRIGMAQVRFDAIQTSRTIHAVLDAAEAETDPRSRGAYRGLLDLLMTKYLRIVRKYRAASGHRAVRATRWPRMRDGLLSWLVPCMEAAACAPPALPLVRRGVAEAA